MKKSNLQALFLIILCLGIFCGYLILDRIRTDDTPPQIHVDSGNRELTVESGREELLRGITATDDVDGDVTDSLVVEDVRILNSAEGIVTVSVAAFDRSGNVSKASYDVCYTDYHSPRFHLSRPLVFTQNSGADILNFVSAEDMVDGDISKHIRATSFSDASVNSQGVHDIQFRVTNSMGDTSELVIPVEVHTAGIYEAGLELTDYLVYLNHGDSFNAEDYLKSFTLNRTTTALNQGLPQGYSLQLSGSVNTQTSGVYTIGYLVTYTVSNGAAGSASRSYTGYSKLIVVVEG